MTPVIARLGGHDVALVPIADGKAIVIIDAEDLPKVAGRNWKLHSQGYACYDTHDRRVYMHTLIAPPPRGKTTDHRNGCPLDNRKSNLRAATRTQQQANRTLPANSTSGYKGCSFHRASGRWRAYIGSEHLGLFDTAIEAARCYDAAARARWGDFARVNFPELEAVSA